MGFFSAFLDILFPPKCVFCRKVLKNNRETVCPDCLAQLPHTGNNAAQNGDFFSVCVSPLYYEDDVRQSLLRYKFKECTGYAGTYAKILADCVKAEIGGRYDLITWVPLSKGRFKERGYDQAMLLALATALELDDVALSTLVKIRETKKQSSLGSAEKRRANISGAYIVQDKEIVQGKRILLIDDIVTTGSSLSECARMLRLAGAAEVLCATVARGRD